MGGEFLARIRGDLETARADLDLALADQGLIEAVDRAAAQVIATLNAGGKVILAGNGGSAADAQHIAGEFVSRFLFDRPSMAALALTTDTSILTSIGNDYGFEDVFSRQIEGLGNHGDVFIGITTSGNSPNILAACRTARRKGLAVIGLTGATGGSLPDVCDLLIRVPNDSTPRIQQIHLVIAHTVCAIAEEAIHGSARAQA